MLIWLRTKKGQAVTGEYVVVFFIVVAALTAMSVYLRRTIQARARDAHVMAGQQAAKGLGSPVSLEYEPYYTRTTSNVDQERHDRTRLVENDGVNRATEGIYRKEFDESKKTRRADWQLPPSMAGQ